MQTTPVIACPQHAIEIGFTDALSISSLRFDGDCKPLSSRWCLDQIAVPPISTGELDIIEQYKFVNRRDQVKIPFPWDVIRLNDGNPFHVLGSGALSVRAKENEF
jgi:hypothetical protein